MQFDPISEPADAKGEKLAMNAAEFDAMIDALTSDEGAMSAICASDLQYLRRMCTFCDAVEITAEDAQQLLSRISAFADDPFDAFLLILRIPREALGEVCAALKGSSIGAPVLPAFVVSDKFGAVLGRYARRALGGPL